jgi:hypothetical protein
MASFAGKEDCVPGLVVADPVTDDESLLRPPSYLPRGMLAPSERGRGLLRRFFNLSMHDIRRGLISTVSGNGRFVIGLTTVRGIYIQHSEVLIAAPQRLKTINSQDFVATPLEE